MVLFKSYLTPLNRGTVENKGGKEGFYIAGDLSMLTHNTTAIIPPNLGLFWHLYAARHAAKVVIHITAF